MTSILKRIAIAGGFAAAVLGVTPALAAGTAAGSTIANVAKVDYNVGGVPQNQLTSNTNNIIVDRKVNLQVLEVGASNLSVFPGQTLQATTFTVQNLSNATIDIGLAVTQQAGGASPWGGTDNFNVTSPLIYVESDAVAGFSAGDTLVTYLDELTADQIRTVYIVATIPNTQVNGDIAAVTLTGQARDGLGIGAQGVVSTATAGANTAGVDTVLADLTGGFAGDVNYDGLYIAKDAYIVAAPLLTVTKVSRVVSDPFNSPANAKMIPGAVVEYCIQVANGAGGATATNIAVSDVVPPQTTFVPGSIRIDATVSGATCSGGIVGGSYTAGTTTVAGTLTGSLTAGNSSGVLFQVTIN
jgi:uncharacterized repeat protein (TIGR01451 family)